MFRQYSRTFLRWWLGQLAALLPAGMRRAVADNADATIVRIDGENLSLLVRRDAALEFIGTAHPNDWPALVHGTSGLPPLLLLRAPAGCVLCKRLSLPLAVRHDLGNVLGLAIDRETPFERSEVYWTYRTLGADKTNAVVEVELIIVPHHYVAPAIDAIRKAGLRVSALALEPEHDILIWVDGIAIGPWLHSQRRLAPLSAAALALFVAAILTPFAVQQLRLDLADRAISAAEGRAQEAAALRRSITERVAAMKYFGRAHDSGESVLGTVAAITRALPDDSFLTRLSLHGRTLTMTGASAQAAGLIAALSHSSAVRDPNFDAPITVDAHGGRETFAISAALVPAGVP